MKKKIVYCLHQAESPRKWQPRHATTDDEYKGTSFTE